MHCTPAILGATAGLRGGLSPPKSVCQWPQASSVSAVPEALCVSFLSSHRAIHIQPAGCYLQSRGLDSPAGEDGLLFCCLLRPPDEMSLPRACLGAHHGENHLKDTETRETVAFSNQSSSKRLYDRGEGSR